MLKELKSQFQAMLDEGKGIARLSLQAFVGCSRHGFPLHGNFGGHKTAFITVLLEVSQRGPGDGTGSPFKGNSLFSKKMGESLVLPKGLWHHPPLLEDLHPDTSDKVLQTASL